MFQLFSQKGKSGRTSKKDRPLLKSTKTVKLRIFKRRVLSFGFYKSRKPAVGRIDKTTKFIISFYLFSRFIEARISYKKYPYQGLRYTNSLNPLHLISIILLFAGIGGMIYFGFDINKPYEIKPVSLAVPVFEQAEQKPAIRQGLPFSKPKHIKIDRVGIDYPVMEVGQKKDGTMETPPLFKDVTGWYKHGPSPGEVGPAIIVGHVDTYKGPSVFWRLRELKSGDVITVTREDKSVVRFKVTGLQQFEQNNFPTKKVYGNTKGSELRLITCGGTFNKQTLRYSENTVVFATIINHNNT
ncbi:MAG TPA: class F sortase [Candidatus Saccharimonadales bacterium]|nr:class F sortase [Candidatus Saccharimonadales bacterium]